MPSTSLESDKHIAAARKRLYHLAGLAGKTATAERAILDAARARLSVVQDDISKLRPRALTDPEAGTRLGELVLERGRLNLVIAHAREAISG